MKQKQVTSTRSLRATIPKKGLGKEMQQTQMPSSRRLQSYSRVELASVLGVRLSELGKLSRMGVFQRIGVDRYLVDYRQAALLLSRQQHPLPAGVSSHLRNPLRAATDPHGSVADARERVIAQQVTDFYRGHDGFLENNVNIVKIPDLHYATLTAGFFLEDGLQCGERVALLSFEHPDLLFSRFSEAGLLFGGALETEQLIYLYYKPDVAHSISLSVDYRELFGEVVRLGGERVQRLVLFNVDALINANSEHLVHTSLHQLIYAANHYQVTLLGLFVASGHVAELIDEGCRAILHGYYVMG